MPKSKYKLQPVLDVRDRAKREAARRVAARRAQLAEEEAELSRRQRLVAECRERQESARGNMLTQLEGGTQAHRVVSDRTHLSDLREQESELKERVAEQRKVVALAESELELALSALVEASKELQVIEKHREEQARQTRRAEQRREQKLSDEIGVIIHGRRGPGDD